MLEVTFEASTVDALVALLDRANREVIEADDAIEVETEATRLLVEAGFDEWRAVEIWTAIVEEGDVDSWLASLTRFGVLVVVEQWPG